MKQPDMHAGNWHFVHSLGSYYVVRGLEIVRLSGKTVIHKGKKP
jgi:hypothetical protein